MATFNERLRELRTQKGYSQQELADKIHVTKQTISQYERGVRKPDYESLMWLCDIFNVSTDYILGKDDVTMRLLGSDDLRKIDSTYYFDSETAALSRELQTNSRLRAYLDVGRNADPEDLEMVINMLKRLKETNPDG